MGALLVKRQVIYYCQVRQKGVRLEIPYSFYYVFYIWWSFSVLRNMTSLKNYNGDRQISIRSVVLRPEGVYIYVERAKTAVEKDH